MLRSNVGCEGKDIDPQVIRKLFTNYPKYFVENKLSEEDVLRDP